MVDNLFLNLSFEQIYLYINLGVLPFWLLLIFCPNNKASQILTNSVVVPMILSATYIYIVYQIILYDDMIFNVFNIYLGLDNLYTLFSDERFLLVFWVHFLSISIFMGSWISRDGIKYGVPKGVVAITLILSYFMGPVGLVLYWLIRIFYSKKIGLYD